MFGQRSAAGGALVASETIALGDPAATQTPENRSAGNVLSQVDLLVGTVIAVAMAIAFTRLSSGWSLTVTFVPGVVFSWLVFAWMYAARIELPRADRFGPLFFAALAIQFLHFAEEFGTGFRT